MELHCPPDQQDPIELSLPSLADLLELPDSDSTVDSSTSVCSSDPTALAPSLRQLPEAAWCSPEGWELPSLSSLLHLLDSQDAVAQSTSSSGAASACSGNATAELTAQHTQLATRRTAHLRARNRSAQARSRARKKAQEAVEADSTLSLSAALLQSNRQRQLLLQSNSLLQAAVLETLQQRPMGRLYVPAVDGTGAMDPRSTVEFRDGVKHPLRWGPAQWKGLAPEAFVQVWQQIVGTMMLQLAAAIRQPSSMASVKLKRLKNEVAALATYLAFAQPGLLLSFAKTAHMVGNLDFWTLVAGAMQVTNQQRQRLEPVMRAYLGRTEQLQGSHQRLQAAVQADTGGPAPDGASAQKQLAAVKEERARLEYDLTAEVTADAAQIWEHTLTPVQASIAAIRSAPASADFATLGLAIVSSC